MSSKVASNSNDSVDSNESESNELFVSGSLDSLFGLGGNNNEIPNFSLSNHENNYQKVIFSLTESPPFNILTTAFTLLNLTLILLEMNSDANALVGASYYARALDAALLGFFTAEVLLRAFAWRSQFWMTWWLVLDLAVVCVGWFIPLARTFILPLTPKSYTILSLVRAIRLVRIFRTLKSLKSMEAIQTILQTLFLSLPALTTIWILTLLIGYFYSVLSSFLFGKIDPKNFGSLEKSALVYLQVSSLDLWTTIYFKNKDEAPALFPVLVSYVIVQTFVVLNLLTAVIVDNLALLRKKLAKSHTRRTTKRKATFVNTVKFDRKKVETNNAEFGLSEYYSRDIPIRTQMCMTTYFQNLAALEFTQHQVHRHQKMLSEMIELLKRQEKLIKKSSSTAASTRS